MEPGLYISTTSSTSTKTIHNQISSDKTHQQQPAMQNFSQASFHNSTIMSSASSGGVSFLSGPVHQANDTKQRLTFRNLPAELRIYIFQLLFPPPRVHELQSGRSLLMYEESSTTNLYERHYPVTLHINRESRRETLRAYNLSVRDVTLIRPNHTHKDLQGQRREFTTWWCFDPDKDIFEFQAQGDGWICSISPTNSSRNPGLIDTIKRLRWTLNNVNLEELGEYTQYQRHTVYTYFWYWTSEYPDTSIRMLLKLRNLESFTISYIGLDPLLNDTDDLYEHPLWFIGATFYDFFAILAKYDKSRTIPNIFLEANNTVIPFTIDLATILSLPRNAYFKSDLSRQGLWEDRIKALLKTTHEGKRWWGKPFRDWEAMKWKNTAMGVPAPLEWDSRYVRIGERIGNKSTESTDESKEDNR